MARYTEKRQSEVGLASLGYNIAVTLACSARRRGDLSASVEQMIQATLDEHASRIAADARRLAPEPLRYAAATIQQMTARWDASKP